MICPGCREPVLAGEMRYAGRMPEENWHAHCWADRRDYAPHTNSSDLRAQLASSIDNLENAFEKLKSVIGRRP